MTAKDWDCPACDYYVKALSPPDNYTTFGGRNIANEERFVELYEKIRVLDVALRHVLLKHVMEST